METMAPHASYDVSVYPGVYIFRPVHTFTRRTATQNGLYDIVSEVRGGGAMIARLDGVYISGRVDTERLVADEDPDGDIVLAWKEYIKLLNKGIAPQGGGVILLQALSVHPNFRGQKLGLHLLKDFYEAFYTMVDCFMSRPHPLTLGKPMPHEECADGIRRLFRYYAKLGFKRIRPKFPLNMVLTSVKMPDVGTLPWEGDL